MTRLREAVFFSVLGLLALFIWTRDLTWASSLDDTLPILVAIPLFVWALWPWNLASVEYSPSFGWLAIGIAFLWIGVATNLTVLLAMGWCVMLWDWLRQRSEVSKLGDVSKLMILPLMAFPWVTLDLQPLGWWFRVTGAAATAQVFGLLGFDVEHQGAQMVVSKMPIYVDAACAGLNTLQSLLIAGSLLAYIQLGHSKFYWSNLIALVLVAWIANTLRIILITAAGLAVSVEFAMGKFHNLGGLAVLTLMFLLSWCVFGIQSRYLLRSSTS